MGLFNFAGDLLGSIVESGAAKDASKVQAASANQAINEQRRQYEQSRQDMMPWLTGGKLALRRLNQLLGIDNYSTSEQGEWNSLLKDFGPADFEQDPGYQFRLGEGAKAVENSAAARGMQLSGPALKALTRYNQDFASNEYGNAWNRDSLEKQRKFNFLTGGSGTGMTTAGNMASLGANTAANVGESYMQAGNARAAGRVGSANAWSNSLRNVSDYYRLQGLLK